jgi:hypothetical protein
MKYKELREWLGSGRGMWRGWERPQCSALPRRLRRAGRSHPRHAVDSNLVPSQGHLRYLIWSKLCLT